MNIEKIKVGGIYYIQCKWSCKSCSKVTVLKIVDNTHVEVVTKNGKPFIANINALHKTADKAVSGYKQHHKNSTIR